MKEFIHRYYNTIICFLLCIFLLKSCQSCNRQKTIEYNQYNYELELDSISNLNDYYKSEIMALQDSISKYKIHVEQLNDKIDILKSSNNHFQRTNRILINTNSNLSNKENI